MKAPTFDVDFASFIDDLGGFIWQWKLAHNVSWDVMAADCGCAIPTLRKLAERTTENPQTYTMWKILKGLDNASVIRHSALERYRGMAKPRKPKRRAKLKEAA